MKKGWEVKKLGEIIRLEYGKPLSESKRKSGGKYPVYGANGEKGRTDEYYHAQRSIIVGRKGSAGEINLSEEKFWPLDVTYFVKFDKQNCDLFFLYHLLKHLDLPKLAKGVKPGINRNEVYAINVRIPSLSTQQRIVSILDEALAGIEKAMKNAEKNLQNAREIFESYLQSIFANPREGWEERRLREITTKIGSGATPFGGEKSYKKYGISLIRSMNVYDKGFQPKDLAFIDNEQADKLSNVIVESGDVLLNITGASIARCCVVPDEILPARVNQHVSIIRVVKNKMIPEFLQYTLTSKVYKEKLLTIGKTAGSTRQALTKARLEGFRIRFPSTILEQKTIIDRINAFSTETKKLEGIYQKKLADLEELKKTILKKAFEGELTRE